MSGSIIDRLDRIETAVNLIANAIGVTVPVPPPLPSPPLPPQPST
jgi:hypothetical protein